MDLSIDEAPEVLLYLFDNFVLKPWLYVLYYAVYLSTVPARSVLLFFWYKFLSILRLVQCFEAVLIYLSVAALIGAVTGVMLHIMSRSLIRYLQITPEDEYRDNLIARKIPKRTVASFREARRYRKAKRLREQQESLATASYSQPLHQQSNPTSPSWASVQVSSTSKGKGVASHSGGGLYTSPTILETEDSSGL